MIMGIPGAGKTTFANTLSSHMAGIPVICTDVVKAAYEDRDQQILSKVSHNAWQLFGDCTNENIVKGYQLFSQTLFSYTYHLALKLLKTYNTIIIEGLGIDVRRLKDLEENIICVFLTNKNCGAGYNDKLKYRTSKNNNWTKNRQVLLVIEEYLLKELENLDVKYCDISDNGFVVDSIVKNVRKFI